MKGARNFRTYIKCIQSTMKQRLSDNIDAMICNISLSEIKSDHSYPLKVYLRMRERERVCETKGY